MERLIEGSLLAALLQLRASDEPVKVSSSVLALLPLYLIP